MLKARRALPAAEAYAAAQGDQMRYSDYIALDVRRATSATVSNAVLINGILTDNVLTLVIPDYYSSYATDLNPARTSVANNPIFP